MISDSSDETSSRFVHTSNDTPLSRTASDPPLNSSPDWISSSRMKIDSLGIIVSHVVTIVGVPSYTSGDQLWNGAADTLNRKPTARIMIPIAHGPRSDVRESTPLTDRSEKMLSRLVRPVYAYTSADPSRIRADDRPPRRKYFRPAAVALSESRYSAARMYTPNDCSSMLRYTDTRSALDTRNVAPHVVNRIIRGYSGIVGRAVNTDRARAARLDVTGAHGRRIIAPIMKMKVSID